MWLKNGYTDCPRCKGDGCWHCQKLGYLLLCPVCANRNPDTINKLVDGTWRCDECSTRFSEAGKSLPPIDHT